VVFSVFFLFIVSHMQNSTSKTLLVVLGPTGVGKTDISLELAEQLACPIISSDSRQFYRELKIGTAAPTEQELARVKHYFIGSHSIHNIFNAGQYEHEVINLLHKLFATHDVVMLVGGSMMYIDAVCNGLDEIPNIDDSTRMFWINEYEQKGLEFVQSELQRLDPVHYLEVDKLNYKRVLHALEVCTFTGKPYSEIRTGIKKIRPFDIIKLGLNRPRPELYERINGRVEKMIADGLVEEARQYFEFRHLNTLNTVGYKELFEYFKANWSLEFAVNMIQQDSRRYAKRQLTWFIRDKNIQWFHPTDKTQIFDFINSHILPIK
jgi:tRNA dimethylallyltransferase